MADSASGSFPTANSPRLPVTPAVGPFLAKQKHMKAKTVITTLFFAFTLASCASIPKIVPTQTEMALSTLTFMPILPILSTTATSTPAPSYIATLQITSTSMPISYPVIGYDVLISPSSTQKVIYDASLGRTFEVIDKNGTVKWAITYDVNKFKDSFGMLGEAWYKPFHWSKDENYLYYTCFHGGEIDGSRKYYGNEFIDGCGVFRLDIKTGETIDILPEIAPGNGYYAFSISPDEKHLVYTHQSETPVQIKLLDMNTREEKILLTADENILETGRFGWSPQGDKLAFMTLKISEDEKRLFSMYILDLKSLKMKLLVKDFDTRIRFRSWDEKGVISYEPDDSGYIWQITIESEMFSLITPTPWPTSATSTP